MRLRIAVKAPGPRGSGRSKTAAPVPGTWSPFRKRELRRFADRILRGGARVHPDSALLVWRASELTSARERRACARSLRGIFRELEGNTLPGAVPLNRRGVRPYAPVLVDMAACVGDLSRSVTPRAMVLVRDLLEDGDSPLYSRPNVGRLPEILQRIQSELGERA